MDLRETGYESVDLIYVAQDRGPVLGSNKHCTEPLSVITSFSRKTALLS
jgi:hypothetical protein